MGHFYAHHTCVTQKRDKQFGWSSNQLSLVGSLLRLEVPIHSHSMCLRVLGIFSQSAEGGGGGEQAKAEDETGEHPI